MIPTKCFRDAVGHALKEYDFTVEGATVDGWVGEYQGMLHAYAQLVQSRSLIVYAVASARSPLSDGTEALAMLLAQECKRTSIPFTKKWCTSVRMGSTPRANGRG